MMSTYGTIVFFSGFLFLLNEIYCLILGERYKSTYLSDKSEAAGDNKFFTVIYLLWVILVCLTPGARFGLILMILGLQWKQKALDKFSKHKWWVERLDALLSIALIVGALYCIWTNKRLF
jgi:divalent metal cation (Fe/Co/Zn/Cd) transporter